MRRVAMLIWLVLIKTTSVFCQQFEFTVQSGHTENVSKLAFSSNSTLLASSGLDKKTIVWDLRSNKQLISIITTEPCSQIFFTQNDSFLVTVEKYQVSKWSLSTGQKENAFVKSINSCTQGTKDEILIISGGNFIVLNNRDFSEKSSTTLPNVFNVGLVSRDKLILLHQTFSCGYTAVYKDGQALQQPNLSLLEEKSMQKLSGRQDALANPELPLVYFKTAHLIQCKKMDEQIKVNKYNHPFSIATRTFFESYSSMAASNNYLLAATNKGFIYVYTAKKGKHIETLNLHEEKVNCIAISPDQKYFASSSSKEIVLWDMQQFKPVHWFSSMSQAISCFDLSGDGKKIVSGTSNGELKFWNMETNEIRQGIVELSASKRSAGISVHISSIKYLNDSLAELELVFGQQDGLGFKRAATYTGTWSINTNSISLSPVKQYSVFDPTYFVNKTKLLSADITKQNSKVNAIGTTLEWKMQEKVFKIEQAHKDEISCVKVDEKNKILYTSCIDGSIKTWDLMSGMPLLTLLSYKNNYLYITPENYYYASKGGLKNVGFKNGLSVYPFEQFDLQYNHPEKIIAKLPFFDEQQQALFANAYKKRIKRLGIDESKTTIDFKDAPQVDLKLFSEKTTKNKFQTIVYTASDANAGIASVHVLINGGSIAQKTYSNLSSLKDSIQVELSSGNNFVQVYATSGNGFSSVKEDLSITRVNHQKPALYILAIGANKFEQSGGDLKYPAKDAEDFSKAYVKNKKYRTVEVKNLASAGVTKKAVFNALQAWDKISVNDEFVLFYAGHGLLDKDLNYYLSTFDVDFNYPEKDGIAYDSLISLLEKIPARNKIVYIDACHSGEVDKEDLVKTNETIVSDDGLVFRSVSGGVVAKENGLGLKNSLEVSKILFADLRQNNGVTVVSSAGGAEYAIEGDKWNNGVFTYCLLNGLKKNKCDSNKDGKIYLDELQQYLMTEVKRLSNGLQVPTSRSENIYNNMLIK